MKKFFLIITTLLFSTLAIAQTPVAYYPFSGNANDAIGTLNGAVNGATLTTDRFGNAGSAYSFNGAGNNINLTNSNVIRPVTAITISAWVFLQHPNGGILGNSVISCSDDAGYNITFFEPNQIEFSVRRNNADASVVTDASAYYNAWHFVVGTYDGRFAKIYIDGVLKGTNDAGAVFSIQYSATANTYIGVEPGPLFSIDPNFNYFGNIDEVKIYDVALTALQIQQEYASSGQIQKPGSGNAINFNGSTQSVNIPNATAINFGTNDFSIGFWYNSANNGKAEIVFEKRDDNCGDGQNWSVRKAADQIYLEVNVPGPTSDVVTILSAADGKWHHIIFTRTVTQLSGFKDGILIATTNATAQNVNNTAPIQIGTGPCSPFFPGGNGFFNGSLDEIQFWNTALTQTQVRDRMCKKITDADPLYSNLVAYYNFDESNGTTVFDGTVNANNGTLINNPSRVTSGAGIGNASSHDYVNAIKTTTISHATGESFTVTSSAGNPDGIQVYRVDEQPNTLAGASGVGVNDKYFGVFQVNGTAPQYTATYNYSGNPWVTLANEFQLRLNKRTDNAATTWSMLTDLPDEPANTITITGESTEYILGKLGAPLPLNLVSFSGTKQNGAVLLNWVTNNETNTAQFVVERSNGTAAFESIGTAQPLNINAGGKYNLTDATPFVSGAVQYYRLKIIDNNGRFVYSNIIRLTNNVKEIMAVFPNPAKTVITINSSKKHEAIITNATGQMMSKIQLVNGSQLLNVSQWPTGIYFIKTEDEVIKLIKQ